MIELKNYQKEAVRKLRGKLAEMLNDNSDRQKLIFKAPTGAGKTVMISALLDEMTRDLPSEGSCRYTQVAWVWIAPNKLHQQSYMAMRNFFSEKRSLRPVMFDECDHLEGLKQGDVLFLNWESINKDNAVLIRDNEQNRTLYELIRRTKIDKKLPLVVIIDEEHMFGGRNAKKSENVLKAILPKIEIRISATPITMSCDAVEVKRRDVIEEEMIKKGIQLNPGVKNDKEQTETTINQRLLKKALDKRNELENAYKESGIRPLLLIQLPNDTSEALSSGDRNIAEEMKAYLSSLGITEENEKLAVWLSKEKSPHLSEITKKDSITQVLIFKQAIALGWDCPRAGVLLIFRELHSTTFTTQTVGRILRMPEQRFYGNDKLNYGYVYTNLSADIIHIVSDDMNYLSTVHANRKEEFNEITLISVYKKMDEKRRNRLGSTFRQTLREKMQESWEQNPMLLFEPEEMFDHDDDCIGNSDDDTPDITDQIRLNRFNARRHGVESDVTNVMVEIPKDTLITGTEEKVEITSKARIARNASELDYLFTLFCRKHVGKFAKHDSTPVLKGALESCLTEFLNVSPLDVPKVVLYKPNQPAFEHLISEALLTYEHTISGDRKDEFKEYEWHVPETRNYNSETCHSTDNEIFLHALQPYFEQNRASASERAFARWIDEQTEWVDWWYKNGDEGKQHFAVPYKDGAGELHGFHVDFIIRLKSGTVCLFDTKTCDSDPDAPAKHNGLQDYIDTYRAKGKKISGGILIAGNGNWYYPEGMIDNTETTDGWTLMDLKTL